MSFIAQLFVVLPNAGFFIMLYMLNHLAYKERKPDCEYNRRSPDFLWSMLCLCLIPLLPNLILAVSYEANALLLVLTASSIIFWIIVFSEHLERWRRSKIDKSIKEAEDKYHIKIDSLYEILVKNGMQCLPLKAIETTVLTESQRKEKNLIVDIELTFKIEACIREKIIDFFNKAKEYEEVKKRVKHLQSLSS